MTGKLTLLKGALCAAAIAAASYIWLLLAVILAVPLWVAFIAAGGTLIVCMAAAARLVLRDGSSITPRPERGDIVVDRDRVLVNPLVNVGALRSRFVLTLGLMLFAGWMIVETLAFSLSTQRSISFACGIALTAVGLATAVGYTRRAEERKQSIVVSGRRLALWQLLGAFVTTLGAWQIVESLVFSSAHVRWLTFENACVVLATAVTALVVHELSSERVVHVLEVAGLDKAHSRREAVGRSA